MKFLILCSLFSFALASLQLGVDHEYTDAWDQLFEPYESKCLSETKMDKNEIEMIRESPSVIKENCFPKCLYTHLGFYNSETKTFKIDLMTEKLKGLTPEIADKCYINHVNEDDDCAIVFTSVMCAIDEVAKKN